MSSDSPVPHDDFPQSWETFYRNDEPWGRTDDGKEFKLTAGAKEPQDGRCGAPLRDYQRRYGEIRYCTQMPESTFVEDGSDYCKLHKSMDDLMERAAELVKHGAFGRNYVIFSKAMDALEFVLAVEMFDGLLAQSRHEFEVSYEERLVEVDTDLIAEDEVKVELPFPSNSELSFQYNELWMAALDEVKVQNMQHIVFNDGVSVKTLADSADMEGKITDTVHEKTEHHLHLPISRLTKDIKEHLKNGGVSINEEDDSSVLTLQKNDYTLEVGPDEESTDDTQNASAETFTKELSEDEAATEITIEE